MSAVIKVENLGKEYRLGEINRHTLYEEFQSRWARFRGKQDPNARVSLNDPDGVAARSGRFWALHDVSFEVAQGEVVGIIGRNGAGKSTLLKILAQITAPTKGRVLLKGRVAGLLEVGTGFHPELTGRENVFLNGTILGMTKRDVASRFDEIAAFSGVEKFLDTPVKRYSSGMTVRLAFAVAAHLEPEILIVDEVLAVGDASFQKKCLSKMGEVAEAGRTVLIVNHNMASIQRFCTRAILLEKGTVEREGGAGEIVQHYLASQSRTRQQQSSHHMETHGDARLTGWSAAGGESNSAVSGGDATIHLHAHFPRGARDVYFGIALWSDDGTLVWAASSNDRGDAIPEVGPGRYSVSFKLRNFAVKPGLYWIEASIMSAHGPLDRWQGYPPLEVTPRRATAVNAVWRGVMDFDYSFAFASETEADAARAVEAAR